MNAPRAELAKYIRIKVFLAIPYRVYCVKSESVQIPSTEMSCRTRALARYTILVRG